MEIWKDIQGYEGHYQVSNLGAIKSFPKRFYHVISKKYVFKKEKIIRDKATNHYGYYNVILRKEGEPKFYLIHRLVAQHFIPNPENKPQVNHKNGIKIDNRVENLEWVTQQENITHAISTGLKNTKGEMHCRHKLTEGDVLAIRGKYKFVKHGCRKLAEEYNVSTSSIHGIIQRTTWRHI